MLKIEFNRVCFNIEHDLCMRQWSMGNIYNLTLKKVVFMKASYSDFSHKYVCTYGIYINLKSLHTLSNE